MNSNAKCVNAAGNPTENPPIILKAPKEEKNPRKGEVTKERKEGRGVPIHPEAKKIAAKVYQFFVAEAKCFQKYEEPLIPLRKVYDRAATALGISASSLRRMLANRDQKDQETAVSKLMDSHCSRMITPYEKAELDKLIEKHSDKKKENKAAHSNPTSNLSSDAIFRKKKQELDRLLQNYVASNGNKISPEEKLKSYIEKQESEENKLAEKMKLERQSYLMQMFSSNKNSDKVSSDNLATHNTMLFHDAQRRVLPNLTGRNEIDLSQNPAIPCIKDEMYFSQSPTISEVKDEMYFSQSPTISEVNDEMYFSQSTEAQISNENFSRIPTVSTIKDGDFLYSPSRILNTNVLQNPTLPCTYSPPPNVPKSQAPRNIFVPVQVGPQGEIKKDIVVRVGSKDIVLPIQNIKKLQSTTILDQKSKKTIIFKINK